MSVDMSALSAMQIRVFFENDTSVTQKQCDDRAREISGKTVSPTTCQGGSSYTVAAGDNIIQFRTPGSLLNMSLMDTIEQAYLNFAPRHKDCGPFHNLRIYTMNNIGGESMYIARDSLYKDNYKLLRNTIDSFAEFVNTFLPMLSFLEHRSLGRILCNTADSDMLDSSSPHIKIRLCHLRNQTTVRFSKLTCHSFNSYVRGFLLASTHCSIH